MLNAGWLTGAAISGWRRISAIIPILSWNVHFCYAIARHAFVFGRKNSPPRTFRFRQRLQPVWP
jgi:hypothetical protein